MIDMSATPDTVLASNSDILGLLAQLSAPRKRRSSRDWNDAAFAHETVAGLFCRDVPAGAPPTTPAVKSAIPAQTSTVMVERTAPPAAQPAAKAARTAESVSRVRRLRRCQCGACNRCLDNARWERIFNEKFADPTYYGPLKIRHNSSLAGGF